jgi:hypothetical protein
MQKSNAPTKLTVAFASGTGAGPVNTVPLTPGATPGTASYQTGFTSVNMEPIASGGVPPFGADFNGVFQAATTAQIWQQSGYMWPFDSGFAGNANIGGYPAGSVLLMGNGKSKARMLRVRRVGLESLPQASTPSPPRAARPRRMLRCWASRPCS